MNIKKPQVSNNDALEGKVAHRPGRAKPPKREKRSGAAGLRSITSYTLEDAHMPEDIHEDFGYNEDWDEQRNLVVPEPRPGFVQRVVRILLDGETDVRNINRRTNQGFRPRLASTAPGFMSILIGDDDVIGDEENILMERPEWMAQRQQEAKDAKRKKQLADVNRNMFTQATPGGGFGDIGYAENETKLIRGDGRRPAPVDENDPAF